MNINTRWIKEMVLDMCRLYPDKKQEIKTIYNFYIKGMIPKKEVITKISNIINE